MIRSIFTYALIFCLVLPSILSSQSYETLEQNLNQAKLLTRAAKFQDAIKMLTVSINDIPQIWKDTSLIVTEINHQIGVNYYQLGQSQKAAPYAQFALANREKNRALHSNLARSYFLYAVILRDNQSFEEAIKVLDKGIALLEMPRNTSISSRDSARLGNMYTEAVQVNKLKGDYGAALFYWEHCHDHLKLLYGSDHPRIGYLFQLRATIHDDLADFEAAAVDYHKALSLIPNSDSYQVDRAIALNNLAFSKAQTSAYQEANRLYLEAYHLFAALNQESPRQFYQQQLANIYSNRVFVKYRKGQLDQGKALFHEGMNFAQAAFDLEQNAIIPDLLMHRALISSKEKSFPEALEFIQSGIHYLVPSFSPKDLADNPAIFNNIIGNQLKLTDILYYKMQIHQEAGLEKMDTTSLINGIKTYSTLDSLLTTLRLSLDFNSSKYALLKKNRRVYEKGIELALKLYEWTQDQRYLEIAYQINAKNKTVLFLDSKNDQSARTIAKIPAALLENERNLKKQYFALQNELYQRIITDEQDPSINLLKDSFFIVKKSYLHFINQLETQFPKYAHHKYSFSNSIVLHRLKSSLDPNQALIEYYVGSNHIYIFQITKQDLKVNKIEKPAGFEQQCLDFRGAVQQDQNLNAYPDIGYKLYQQLLKEELEGLSEKGSIEKLTIIPDDVLLFIPFESLLYEQAESPEQNNLPFLLNKYIINYAYSANRLMETKTPRRLGPAQFGGFGLEYDDYTLEGVEQILGEKQLDYSKNRKIGKLYYSVQEVETIADMFNGNAWLNRDATKQRFLDVAENMGILHFAMHGYVTLESPTNSALIFTRPADSDDFLLRVSDLYTMELNAKLAVLSACNTGYGPYFNGEGVKSLANAFHFAGCNSIVSSLWEASDVTTKDILIDFYSNLKKGMPKDKSLNAAKKKYLETASPAFRHPSYWSHLILIGDQSPLKLSKSNSFLYWMIGGLLILGLLYGRYKKNQ